MNFIDYGIKLRFDEYEKDGMIYCKQCHTQRVYVSEDKKFVVRCLCKCQSEQREKEIELEKQKQQLEKVKRLKEMSLLGRKYKNSSFENLDLNRPESFLKAVKRCQAYCKAWTEINNKGYGLYLYGDVGTGKTELMACICNYLTEKFVPVIITNFLEISKKLRASYTNDIETENDIIERLAKVDLLILDDVGAEKLKKKDNTDSFMQEKIYDIINRRYINQMPTLFTSNYCIQDLLDERGFEERTIDRIAEMSNAVIKLDGDSYREIVCKRKTKEAL